MVAKPETLNRFLFNSDYPTDKVVWLYEGETTSPSETGRKEIDIDIASMLGTTKPIYIKGAFTLDNWETAFMIGGVDNTTDAHKMVEMDMYWYSGRITELELFVSARTDYSVNLPVKYRLWGVVREDVNSAVDFGKNSGITKSKLAFDSRKNYPRLYKDGIAKSGDTITHDLGKIPFVDYWYGWSRGGVENSWTYSPTGEFGNSPTVPTIRATDKAITFMPSSGNETWYYYRIYA